MGWFSKKEKVVETEEQKHQRFLENQFKNLQVGNSFEFKETFAIFNKRTGNLCNHEGNVMFNTVDKAVEIKAILNTELPVADLVIVKVKKASFFIV